MTNFDMFVDVVERFTCPCHFTMLNHCLSSVRGMHCIVLYLLCMWWNKALLKKKKDIDRVHRVGRPGTGTRQILVKFATYGTRASVFKAKAILRPGGRHPRSPWTLGDAAGVTSESAEVEVPPHGESATATNDNTTTNVDGDDDDADNTDMDYSKIYISEDLTRQRQFIFWKTRQAKKKP